MRGSLGSLKCRLSGEIAESASPIAFAQLFGVIVNCKSPANNFLIWTSI